jgi:hypothetical protein
MCVIRVLNTRGALIAHMQDGKEEDIRAITSEMLHGQVDVLYVPSGTPMRFAASASLACELIVPLSGFWARRKTATPSRTSCAPERSLGQARDLSPLRRCSSGSSRGSRSSTKRSSTSGKALTSFMRSAYTSTKASRLAHRRLPCCAPAGAPGRPRRPLQACLCPHPESRGFQG